MSQQSKLFFSFTHLAIVVLLALAVVLAGFHFQGNQDIRSNAQSFDNQFVTRVGTKFFLGGQEFRFVGFNLFDAANTYFPEQGKTGYSCPRDNGWWTGENIYTEAKLDTAFAHMKEHSGTSVVRFWAFQRYTNGGQDWSGMDKVIRVAKKHGLKVLPVLEDGPGYCTYPEPQGNAKWKYNSDTWYTDGYKLKMGNYPLTYPEYVQAIVTRYKDEPAIFGWAMMNEADTSKRVDGKSPLVEFGREIGTLIKSIDNKHLITVGTQSNGASGATGRDFYDVHNLPMIDFTEIHDWPYWGGDTDPLPGSPDGINLPDPDSPDCVKTYQAKLACSIAYSVQKLNKPILMGEAGIGARDAAGRTRRATLMDAKINAFFRAGGAGYLVWQWNTVIDGEAYDVQITTNDPLLPVMKKYAFGGSPVPTTSISPTPTTIATPTTVITPRPTATPQPTASFCAADINTDGIIDLSDYSILVVNFLKSTITNPRADITKDGVVDLSDYSVLATKFFQSTAQCLGSSTPTPTSLPTPTPTVAPTPTAPATAILKSSDMSITSGDWERVPDTLAQYGSTLILKTNATAVGQITGSVQRLSIRAKSDLCSGAGHINMQINGQYVLDANITSDTYTEYQTNSLSYLNLTAGPHEVKVIYNNDFQSATCNRNIKIDFIKGM